MKFLSDPVVQGKFSNARKLAGVNQKDYDAIFYVGGHGPVIDLAVDPVNIKLINDVRVSWFLDWQRCLFNFAVFISSMPRTRLFLQFAMVQRKSL